jgi:hypothetical protein
MSSQRECREQADDYLARADVAVSDKERRYFLRLAEASLEAATRANRTSEQVLESKTDVEPRR